MKDSRKEEEMMKEMTQGHKKYVYMIYFLLLLGLCWYTNRYLPRWMYSIDHWFKDAVNIIPFKTIWTYFSSFWTGMLNVNIPIRFFIMNSLVGCSMGILYFITNRQVKLSQLVKMSMIFFVLFEAITLILHIGFFDIDAIMIRTLFAVVGYKMILRLNTVHKIAVE